MTPAYETASLASFPWEPREFSFDASDFQQIASLLYADSGIYLPPQKATLVYGRLAKRLRALGLQSFKDYCRLIAAADGDDERREMLCALTTNVTAFLRERHHFDHLKTIELPRLLEGAKRGARLRLWSAGCSKGHEAYSMAITILGLMPDAAKYDIKILATDIDPTVIETARAGVYGSDELAALSQADRARFFEPSPESSDDDMVVSAKLRGLVAFRVLNFMEPWPVKGRFQIIFCRNVAIYFDAATQASLWNRFASVLGPEGLLCIGHSERLSGGAADRFETVGTTMYRLIGGARS